MAKLYKFKSRVSNLDKCDVFYKQSQRLLNILQRHREIHEQGKGDYLFVIKELINYISITFHEENIILMQVNYPDFLEHAREHQKFARQVEEFLKSYEQKDQSLGFKIFVFLKTWISEHTSKLDMECADYLSKKAVSQIEEYEDGVINENEIIGYLPRA